METAETEENVESVENVETVETADCIFGRSELEQIAIERSASKS